MDISGQAIFNFLIIVLAALVELWPWFADWWDSNDWRDFYFLLGCFAVAGILLGICAAGFAVENCTLPIDWDDAAVAAQAAIAAFGLFYAARLFVRGGLFTAQRIRAAFWDILR